VDCHLRHWRNDTGTSNQCRSLGVTLTPPLTPKEKETSSITGEEGDGDEGTEPQNDGGTGKEKGGGTEQQKGEGGWGTGKESLHAAENNRERFAKVPLLRVGEHDLFLKDFYSLRRPVVLREALQNWTVARERWTKPRFRGTYRHLAIEVSGTCWGLQGVIGTCRDLKGLVGTCKDL